MKSITHYTHYRAMAAAPLLLLSAVQRCPASDDPTTAVPPTISGNGAHVILQCAPSDSAEPTVDLEKLRQDYACFLAGMQDVAEMMQNSAAFRDPLRRAIRVADPVAANDLAPALREARRSMRTLQRRDLQTLERALSGAPGWRGIPDQLKALLASSNSLRPRDAGSCPPGPAGGIKDVAGAQATVIGLGVVKDFVDKVFTTPEPIEVELPNPLRPLICEPWGIAIGVVNALSEQLALAGVCAENQYRQTVEDTLTHLADPKRFTDDTERDQQTTAITTTIGNHGDDTSQKLQDALSAQASSNQASLLTNLTAANANNSAGLIKNLNTVAGQNAGNLTATLGTPSVTLLADLQGVSNGNRRDLLAARQLDRQALVVNLIAARNAMYANANANTTRELAELATRTEQLRIANCEAIRLAALNGATVSECPICADQRGYPYGAAPAAPSPPKRVSRPSLAARHAAAPPTQVAAPAVSATALAARLRRADNDPQLALPAARGGYLEQTRSLVWSSANAAAELGLLPDGGPVRGALQQADRALRQGRYSEAARQYAATYRQLAALIR